MVNFQSHSMGLRFGLYGGIYTKSIPSSLASEVTSSHFWYRALSNTICIFLPGYSVATAFSIWHISVAVMYVAFVMVWTFLVTKLIAWYYVKKKYQSRLFSFMVSAPFLVGKSLDMTCVHHNTYKAHLH